MENNEYRSTEINDIAAALAEAQGSYKELIPNEMGTYGPYANLQATFFCAQPALKDNGLSFGQSTKLADGGEGIRLLWSFLMHKSGQWLSSCERIVLGDNDLENGKKIEIVKRRQAQMLLGIAPSPNDPASRDDNGESSHDQGLYKKALRPVDAPLKTLRNETISNQEYDMLMGQLEHLPEVAKSIANSYGLDTLADLPRTDFSKVMAKILKIKKTADDHADRVREKESYNK